MADGYGSLGTSRPNARLRGRTPFISDLHLGARPAAARHI
jgi:hypothetical protein